jgi:hypothetical protein
MGPTKIFALDFSYLVADKRITDFKNSGCGVQNLNFRQYPYISGISFPSLSLNTV